MGSCCSADNGSLKKTRSLNDLSESELNQMPVTTYQGLYVPCRFPQTGIYDGDTAKIVFSDPKTGVLIKASFRFYGFDAPEMKLPRAWEEEKRTLEKQKAKAAKAELARILATHQTYVEFMKNEKYGRMMGEVYLFGPQVKNFRKEDGQKVSEYMIKNTESYAYHGGTKKSV
jgi:endonuclease YncB( thermonuclease family)